MATRTLRMLSSVTLQTGDAIALTDTADLSLANVVDIVVNIVEAGTGAAPKLRVRHSATNEAGTWLDFPTPAEVDLTATGLTWIHADAFTRYLGWDTSGTLETPAVVTLDVIAKG